jgi:hypothetical protein
MKEVYKVGWLYKVRARKRIDCLRFGTTAQLPCEHRSRGTVVNLAGGERVHPDGPTPGWLAPSSQQVRVEFNGRSRGQRLWDKAFERIEKLGRIRGSTILVHGLLQKKPYLTISTASKGLRLSQPAVTKAMRALQKLELSEKTAEEIGTRSLFIRNIFGS